MGRIKSTKELPEKTTACKKRLLQRKAVNRIKKQSEVRDKPEDGQLRSWEGQPCPASTCVRWCLSLGTKQLSIGRDSSILHVGTILTSGRRSPCQTQPAGRRERLLLRKTTGQLKTNTHLRI